MYIRGLIPRNFAELAEAVPIAEPYAPQFFFVEVASVFALLMGHDIKIYGKCSKITNTLLRKPKIIAGNHF